MEIAFAAVSMKSALKYRRRWDKQSPVVKLLQKLMPKGNAKGYRLYLPIGGAMNATTVRIPPAVRHALKKAGYVATDYLAKKCVKIGDKEQKNVFNIGKVIAKDHIAKAAFDNDPQLQNSKISKFEMVVSCHPYDIIGMSTGRDWDNESCMRLRDDRKGVEDGINVHILEGDVAEGTLVVYALKNGDTNIETPLGRCLIKPFINEKGDVMWRRETKVYGNPVPGFIESLNKFLRRLNKNVPDGMYTLSDKLYDDGVGRYAKKTAGNSKGIDWSKVVKINEYLKTTPEDFPGYVSYVLSDLSDYESHAEEQILHLRNNARDVDAKNIKIGARMIASNPKAVKAFVEAIKHGNDNGVGRFLKSKHLAQEVKKLLPEKYDGHLHNAFTHVSKKLTEKVLENLDDNNADWASVAMRYVTGKLNLHTKDIVARPNLHAMIWEILNMYREAAMYGVTAFEDSVHAILGKLPPPEKPGIADDDQRSLLVLLQNTVVDYDLFATWMIQLLRDGHDEQAYKVADDLLGQTSFNALLTNRKWRKKLVNQNFPENIQQFINSAVTNILSFDKGDASTQRDLVAAVQTSGIMVDDIYSLPSLLRAQPELFPVIEADTPAIDGYSLSVLFPHGSELAHTLKSFTGSQVARNQNQQNLWDMIGTCAMVQKNAPEHFTFQFSSEETMKQLEKSNLQSDSIDLVKFPQLISTRTNQSLQPSDFLGHDRAFRYIRILEKKYDSPRDFAQVMGGIMYNADKMKSFAYAAGAPPHICSSDTEARSWFNNAAIRLDYDPAAIRRDCADYLQRCNDFVATFPEKTDDTENPWMPYVEWFEVYSYEQVKKDSFNVSGVFYQIKEEVRHAKETLDTINRWVKTADEIAAEDDSLLDDILS